MNILASGLERTTVANDLTMVLVIEAKGSEAKAKSNRDKKGRTASEQAAPGRDSP